MNIKKVLKQKKGNLSILGIFLVLIVITVIAGTININNASWIVNEVQSIMDISATNALQNSLDTKALRDEIISVLGSDSSVENDGKVVVEQDKVNKIVKDKYIQEINRAIKTNDLIKSFKIVRFNSELEYSSWGLNYGTNTNKRRPQLSIDSVIQITLKYNEKYDGLNTKNLNVYDAKSGGNFTINVAGKTNDGEIILTVRNLSRLVYR